jgi:hypothetical protein
VSKKDPSKSEYVAQLGNGFPRLIECADNLVRVVDPIRPQLQEKIPKNETRALGIAVTYIFVTAYKTFQSLRKVCEPPDSWGQQALVYSRILFENYITVRWIAADPNVRATQFVKFDIISQIQGFFITGGLDESFVKGGTPLSPSLLRLRTKFLELLPLYDIDPTSVRSRKDILKLRWTKKELFGMISDLAEPKLLADYEALGTFGNSVVHSTQFSARANITEDLRFNFEPDPYLAAVALGYSVGHFGDLCFLLDRFLALGLKTRLEEILHQWGEIGAALGVSQDSR